MTVIVWDGKKLAGDCQETLGNRRVKTKKIFRVPGGIVGFSGDSPHGQDIVNWFRDRTQPFPQNTDENHANVLFVNDDGNVFVYWGYSRGNPIDYGFEPFAIGSGADFALAAMACGRDARQAVKIACRFDNSCGLGVDVLRLKEKRGSK